MPKVTLEGYMCRRCHHVWTPRFPHPPKVCPVCKRTDWDSPDTNNNAPSG